MNAMWKVIPVLLGMLPLAGTAAPGDGDFAAGKAALLRGGDTGTERAVAEGAAYARFLAAARAGHPAAMDALGMILVNGRGVEKDVAAGLDWLRRSAAAGNPRAHYSLGLMAAAGRHLPRDAGAAVAHWQAAAAAGHAGAAYRLALASLRGEGTPRDDGVAREWLARAAEGGDPEARALLEGHGCGGTDVVLAGGADSTGGDHGTR